MATSITTLHGHQFFFVISAISVLGLFVALVEKYVRRVEMTLGILVRWRDWSWRVVMAAAKNFPSAIFTDFYQIMSDNESIPLLSLRVWFFFLFSNVAIHRSVLLKLYSWLLDKILIRVPLARPSWRRTAKFISLLFNVNTWKDTPQIIQCTLLKSSIS